MPKIKQIYIGIILGIFVVGSAQLWAINRPAKSKKANTGTFFQEEQDVIDQLYYLDMSNPPQIKHVVFASGNKPETIVAQGGPFDISPRYRTIVYSFNNRLWLTELDGKGKTLLTRGEGTHPKWAPNGELIAYIDKLRSGKEAISVMDKLGEKTDSLLIIDQVIDFFWENNSENILLVVKRNGSYYIIRVSLDAYKDILYQFPKQIEIKEAAFSPYSKKLAYLSQNKTGEETVFLVDLNIYRLFRLTRPYQECYGLSWSYDGKSLVFSGDNDLYTVKDIKGNVYKLQKGVKQPAWSRNSNKIVYTKMGKDSKTALYNVRKDYIQDLDIGSNMKKNMILIEKRKSLTDVQVVKADGNITYSNQKKIRQKLRNGMLIPLNSSVQTDAFSTAVFLLGEDVSLTVSPRSEVKIDYDEEDGYFDEVVNKRELKMKVLEGQIEIKEQGKTLTVNAGEEYVVSLAKATAAVEDEPPQSLTASLLFGRTEKIRQKSAKSAAKQSTSKLQMEVNHPHGDDAWSSDCLKCHPRRPDWSMVDYKTVEFTPEIASTCITCHRPGEEFTDKLVYNKHNFLDDPDRCEDCHRETPLSGIDSYRTVTFVDNISTLCNNCHGDDDIGATHPIGMVPKIKKYVSNVKTPDTIRVMDVPPDLHLDDEGLMTCATCHVVHGKWRTFEKPYSNEKPLGEVFDQEFYRTYFLRRNNYNSGLCVACHGQAGY